MIQLKAHIIIMAVSYEALQMLFWNAFAMTIVLVKQIFLSFVYVFHCSFLCIVAAAK